MQPEYSKAPSPTEWVCLEEFFQITWNEIFFLSCFIILWGCVWLWAVPHQCTRDNFLFWVNVSALAERVRCWVELGWHPFSVSLMACLIFLCNCMYVCAHLFVSLSLSVTLFFPLSLALSLSVTLFILLSLCNSIYTPLSLSHCNSLYPSFLSVTLFIPLSLALSLSVTLFILLSLCNSIYTSLSLSLSLSHCNSLCPSFLSVTLFIPLSFSL